MRFIQEFKEFAMRGNVVDMAVGVVIGGAFGKIVSSLVDDIIMPIISVITGGINFSDLKVVLSSGDAGSEIEPITFNYGMFIQNVVDFLIIALCIFTIIKMMNSLKKPKKETPTSPAEPSNEEKLLQEIRDLLKNK